MEREGLSWCQQWFAPRRKSASRWVQAVGRAVCVAVRLFHCVRWLWRAPSGTRML